MARRTTNTKKRMKDFLAIKSETKAKRRKKLKKAFSIVALP
jgi:hypothetical protein